MDYDSPGAIITEVLMLQQSQQVLQRNRTLVNSLFNGDSTYTDEEAQEENINTNVNFLEGTRIASNATAQLNKAILHADRFFTVRVDKGPAAVRQRVGAAITKLANKEMKCSRLYRSAKESAHAQVVLHGPGAVVWRSRRSVLPTTAGIEDILVPSGTLCDMSNLDTFAIYREMVWSQLEQAAFGDAADPGWNKEYVKALLGTLYKLGFQPIYQGNRWLFPEKIAEDYKEGAWQTYSSSMPKVLAWDFFYRNDDTGKWNRKMVLDYANIAAMPGIKGSDAIMTRQEVLYEKDDYAEDWQEIVHWYVGNCSNVAPYRFHSIRSIGYLLYGVVALQNKLRCRLSDHVFQQLLTWFRSVSEDNREKLNLIDLQNFGVMPDGVSMVGANERHVADWNLVLMQMNQNRQLMSESSAAFLPDMQGALGNEGREMTATETLVRQNTSITLTSAVLGQLGDQSLYEYREICRRLCMKSNPDPLAVKFREGLKKEGVPMDYLDFDCWEVVPEMSVGAGNKASELTVTQALLQEVFPLVDANAQRIILRRRYTALTDNPDEALAVVPEAPNAGVQDDAQYAQVAFTILMEGLPFTDKEGVNHVVMAMVLMQLTGQTLQQAQAVAQQPEGLGIAAQKVAGVANVLAHAQQEIMKVGQADSRKDVAKGMMKQWEQLNGMVQQVAQAVQKAEEEKMQAQQANGGLDPATAAKVQQIAAMGQVTRENATKAAQQKLEQRQVQWLTTTQQKTAMVQGDIKRKLMTTGVDLAAKDATTKQALAHAQAEHEQELAQGASEPTGA